MFYSLGARLILVFTGCTDNLLAMWVFITLSDYRFVLRFHRLVFVRFDFDLETNS